MIGKWLGTYRLVPPLAILPSLVVVGIAKPEDRLADGHRDHRIRALLPVRRSRASAWRWRPGARGSAAPSG